MTAVNILVGLAALIFTSTAMSETNIVITAFNKGVLTWSNVDTQLYYNVQWKCSLDASNEWSSVYRGCQDLQSTSDCITVPVPMFYRICGTSNPVSTCVLSPSTVLVASGYYEESALDQVDVDLIPGNIKKDVDLFGVTGTLEGAGTLWPAPVPKTGQSTSYRTGDDGELKPGVAWPSPRFTINAATWTVTDNLTGLMWTRISGICGLVNWDTAIDRCNDHSEFGYSDWRLPTLRELLSLIDVRYQFPALCDTTGTAQHTNQNPFYNVQDAIYWTSTSRGAASTMKWYVDMRYGIINYSSGSVSYYQVWPVRDVD